MTNHPNRNRLPYTTQTHPGMSMGYKAKFSCYRHAMEYAIKLSKETGYAEVLHKTGIIGQYEKGKTTEEFQHHHDTCFATV